ncbi:hypothetical protein V8G54_007672 [Vigna mungo]|uniref:Uncharacterized protein n=1 Tax=Vigna mungo TaxID=3915 RepID=A0AAQ3P3R5_VIGMU
MFNKLLYLKCVTSSATSRYPFLLSLCFCTATSNSRSFAVSYLIDNFGFSPVSASKTCKSYNISFQTSEKPETVIRFFRNHGFPNIQIKYIVTKAPWFLSCDPCKRLLPKFEFFLSKDVSSSEIVDLISKYPGVLRPSLKNHIVPPYELIYKFLQCHVKTYGSMFRNTCFFGGDRLTHKIILLLENEVSESNIARLLGKHTKALFASNDIVKSVKEVKDLGFDPSETTFFKALMAIKKISPSLWKAKVDTLKKWGWSDEAVSEAFRRHPHFRLQSIKKINAVMNLWVNELGRDPLELVHCPKIFCLSIEKTIIPRARVLQHLPAKGLRKSASFVYPISVSEKLFLARYVTCFKEESCQLLKLYQEKVSVQGKEEVGAAWGSSQIDKFLWFKLAV